MIGPGDRGEIVYLHLEALGAQSLLTRIGVSFFFPFDEVEVTVRCCSDLRWD